MIDHEYLFAEETPTTLVEADASPEVIDTDLAMKKSDDPEITKQAALQRTRETLDKKNITLDYILDVYKDAAEHAMTETYSGTLLDDHKTRISAANKMLETWKVAHGLDKKDPVEIVFKPLFDKPPLMN